jgi:hypothetical protein
MKAQKWQTTTLVLGAVIGALAGLGAAFLLIQRAEKENTQPKLTAGEGVKLSLGVLGLMRQVADLGSEK